MIRPIVRTWKPYGYPDFKCKYCGGPNDPYMVQFKLWEKVIGDINCGLVCLECFEKRLGRELEYKDFIEYNSYGQKLPINFGYFGFNVIDFLNNRKKSA